MKQGTITAREGNLSKALSLLKKNYTQLKGMLHVRLLLIASSMLLAATVTHAQTDVGLRFGGTSGITIKAPFAGATGEAIIGISPSGLSLTGLYEITKPSSKVTDLYWYYGAGGHATVRSGRYYFREGRYYYSDRYYGGAFGVGVDGILGMEYKLTEIPFSLSLDIKPYIEINTDGLVYFNPDPGLGIKFRF